MIVKCEQCLTKFKLDASRVKGDAAKVRCSQCGYVFTVPVEKEKAAAQPAPVEQPKPVPRATLAPHDDNLNMTGDEIDRLIAMQHGMGARKRGRGSKKILTLLTFLFMVAVGAGAYFYLAPPRKPALVQPPPQAEAADESFKDIVLSSAEGYFKQNKNAGTLFVIKGVAQNKNNFAVSFIKLKGILHDTNARVALEREVYAGNLFTDEELSELPMERIIERSNNKAGFDNANYRIPEGAPFPI